MILNLNKINFTQHKDGLMTMKRLLTTLVLLSAMLFSACSTTQFQSTWQDPDAVFGKLNGQKIAAFLISDNESSRRAVENALAGELTRRGGHGVAGHTVLSGEQARDEAVAAEKLAEAGVDAVITMRTVSENQLTTTTPGTWHRVPTYRLWEGYWYPSWRSLYEPGQLRTNTVVQVETLIYDMDSRKLIWAGLSKTTNPGDADEFVRELASEMDKVISKTGLMH